MKEKYGDLFQKTDLYREKYKRTCIERYGVENYMSTEEGIQKRQNTSRKNHNGLLYQQTDEFKKLASNQYYEKNKKEKTAKGQRDAFYKRLKEKAESLRI